MAYTLKFKGEQIDNLLTRVQEQLPEDGSFIEVDTELSETSTNPVQNKVITEALNKKSTGFPKLYVSFAGSPLTAEQLSNNKAIYDSIAINNDAAFVELFMIEYGISADVLSLDPTYSFMIKDSAVQGQSYEDDVEYIWWVSESAFAGQGIDNSGVLGFSVILSKDGSIVFDMNTPKYFTFRYNADDTVGVKYIKQEGGFGMMDLDALEARVAALEANLNTDTESTNTETA